MKIFIWVLLALVSQNAHATCENQINGLLTTWGHGTIDQLPPAGTTIGYEDQSKKPVIVFENYSASTQFLNNHKTSCHDFNNSFKQNAPYELCADSVNIKPEGKGVVITQTAYVKSTTTSGKIEFSKMITKKIHLGSSCQFLSMAAGTTNLDADDCRAIRKAANLEKAGQVLDQDGSLQNKNKALYLNLLHSCRATGELAALLSRDTPRNQSREQAEDYNRDLQKRALIPAGTAK